MRTIILLIASNVFMTFAWYYHLKQEGWPLWKAIMFAVFAVVYLQEPLHWKYLVSFCFLLGAVYFMFKK